jgi:hypothetical protein
MQEMFTNAEAWGEMMSEDRLMSVLKAYRKQRMSE